MKSQTIAPVQTRNKLSKEVLLQALEAAEIEINDFYVNPTKIVYESMSKTVTFLSKDINQIVQDGKLDITADKDEKTFDRVMKYFEKAKDFTAVLEALRKNLNPEDAKIIDEANTKSIVNLVKNKKDL